MKLFFEPILDGGVAIPQVAASFKRKTIMADLCIARGTGTGLGMVGMLEWQLKSVGVASWSLPGVAYDDSRVLAALALEHGPNYHKLEPSLVALEHAPHEHAPAPSLVALTHDPHEHGPEPSLEAQVEAHKGLRSTVPGVLDVWAVTSDAGLDIATARRFAESEVADEPWSWFFQGDCLLHQFHIICQRRRSEI